MCIYETFLKNYGRINLNKAKELIMTTVKVMSIIGIVLFSIGFLSIVGLLPQSEYNYTDLEIENMEAALGLGILIAIYGIAYSITCLVQSNKHKKQDQI